MLLDGRGYSLPWKAALELGQQLISQARAAEEFAVANRIIADQALLTRTGAPFALSNNSAIRAAAKTMAQWDSSLRRYIKAAPRQGVVGVPTVNQELTR